MPASKTRTSLWAATSLVAATPQTSATIDLSTAYGAILDLKITNGGTGPTVAAQFQVQVAADYNAGSPHLWVNYGGALVGSVTAGAVSHFSVELPIGVEAVQVIASGNTAQNVTIDADISAVTGI